MLFPTNISLRHPGTRSRARLGSLYGTSRIAPECSGRQTTRESSGVRLTARRHPPSGDDIAVQRIPRNSGEVHLNCFGELDLPACYPRSLSTGKVIRVVWVSPKPIRPGILLRRTQQCSNRRGPSCQIGSQAVACAAGHNLRQIANP